MNGFISTVLSLLLGWMRTLTSQLWSLAGSEAGGRVFAFWSNSWLTVVIILCIAGLVLDRVVYFFRWRPDTLWRSRRQARRDKREPAAEPVYEQPVYDEPAELPEAPSPYARPPQEEPSPYARPREPEPEELWAPEPVYEEPQPRDVNAYYRDVQAGFAPPIDPGELYAQPPAQPLHPGLDKEAIRQNFALDEVPQPSNEPVGYYAPAFHPYTEVSAEDQPAPQSRMTRLARRARRFMNPEDDETASIRDLQATVDISKAFHAPVYPQPADYTDYKEG